MQASRSYRLVVVDAWNKEQFDSHFVLCKRSCLIRADNVGSSHCLAGIDLSNEVIISQHFFGRVGQSNGNCQWQTFRNTGNCG